MLGLAASSSSSSSAFRLVCFDGAMGLLSLLWPPSFREDLG